MGYYLLGDADLRVIPLQKTIRETFNLEDVPKEALYIGMAGLLPYVATSLSTVYLAWDINHAAMYGQGFLLSGPTAEAMLHLVEPLQIGYGAVVSWISSVFSDFLPLPLPLPP